MLRIYKHSASSSSVERLAVQLDEILPNRGNSGDGIGKEVVPEGIRVLEAAGRRFGFECRWQEFDWSCETYLKTGRMMPADGLQQLRPFDAIFLGAVGHPSVPDHVSLWGLLIPIRRTFRQYVN